VDENGLKDRSNGRHGFSLDAPERAEKLRSRTLLDAVAKGEEPGSNRRLKKLLAESMLDVAALKDLLAKNRERLRRGGKRRSA